MTDSSNFNLACTGRALAGCASLRVCKMGRSRPSLDSRGPLPAEARSRAQAAADGTRLPTTGPGGPLPPASHLAGGVGASRRSLSGPRPRGSPRAASRRQRYRATCMRRPLLTAGSCRPPAVRREHAAAAARGRRGPSLRFCRCLVLPLMSRAGQLYGRRCALWGCSNRNLLASTSNKTNPFCVYASFESALRYRVDEFAIQLSESLVWSCK